MHVQSRGGRLIKLSCWKKNWEGCKNEEEVVEEISNYYSKLFTSTAVGGWEEKLNGISSIITDSMNSSLIKPMEDCEIIAAIFSMNPNKAPGINGMTPYFFQNFWHIIYFDICTAVKSFF